MVDVPYVDSIWQLVKKKYFPKWFIGKFPVKYKWIFKTVFIEETINKDVKIEAWTKYPKLPMIFPKCGDVIISSIDVPNIHVKV